jgi:hypothetical protein
LYIIPFNVMDNHPILDAAMQQMPSCQNKGLNAVLLFKWPPYLLLNLAFPVVTSWVPTVHFIALLFMYGSALHALVMFGDALASDPVISGTCKVVGSVLTSPITLAMKAFSADLRPTSAPEEQSLHCQHFILAFWLVCVTTVFWLSLLWQARMESKERAEFLVSLGTPGTITWPHFRVMVLQLIFLQVFLFLYLILALEHAVLRID